MNPTFSGQFSEEIPYSSVQQMWQTLDELSKTGASAFLLQDPDALTVFNEPDQLLLKTVKDLSADLFSKVKRHPHSSPEGLKDLCLSIEPIAKECKKELSELTKHFLELFPATQRSSRDLAVRIRDELFEISRTAELLEATINEDIALLEDSMALGQTQNTLASSTLINAEFGEAPSSVDRSPIAWDATHLDGTSLLLSAYLDSSIATSVSDLCRFRRLESELSLVERVNPKSIQTEARELCKKYNSYDAAKEAFSSGEMDSLDDQVVFSVISRARNDKDLGAQGRVRDIGGTNEEDRILSDLYRQRGRDIEFETPDFNDFQVEAVLTRLHDLRRSKLQGEISILKGRYGAMDSIKLHDAIHSDFVAMNTGLNNFLSKLSPLLGVKGELPGEDTLLERSKDLYRIANEAKEALGDELNSDPEITSYLRNQTKLSSNYIKIATTLLYADKAKFSLMPGELGADSEYSLGVSLLRMQDLLNILDHESMGPASVSDLLKLQQAVNEEFPNSLHNVESQRVLDQFRIQLAGVIYKKLRNDIQTQLEDEFARYKKSGTKQEKKFSAAVRYDLGAVKVNMEAGGALSLSSRDDTIISYSEGVSTGFGGGIGVRIAQLGTGLGGNRTTSKEFKDIHAFAEFLTQNTTAALVGRGLSELGDIRRTKKFLQQTVNQEAKEVANAQSLEQSLKRTIPIFFQSADSIVIPTRKQASKLVSVTSKTISLKATGSLGVTSVAGINASVSKLKTVRKMTRRVPLQEFLSSQPRFLRLRSKIPLDLPAEVSKPTNSTKRLTDRLYNIEHFWHTYCQAKNDLTIMESNMDDEGIAIKNTPLLITKLKEGIKLENKKKQKKDKQKIENIKEKIQRLEDKTRENKKYRKKRKKALIATLNNCQHSIGLNSGVTSYFKRAILDADVLNVIKEFHDSTVDQLLTALTGELEELQNSVANREWDSALMEKLDNKEWQIAMLKCIKNERLPSGYTDLEEVRMQLVNDPEGRMFRDLDSPKITDIGAFSPHRTDVKNRLAELQLKSETSPEDVDSDIKQCCRVMRRNQRQALDQMEKIITIGEGYSQILSEYDRRRQELPDVINELQSIKEDIYTYELIGSKRNIKGRSLEHQKYLNNIFSNITQIKQREQELRRKINGDSKLVGDMDLDSKVKQFRGVKHKKEKEYLGSNFSLFPKQNRAVFVRTLNIAYAEAAQEFRDNTYKFDLVNDNTLTKIEKMNQSLEGFSRHLSTQDMKKLCEIEGYTGEQVDDARELKVNIPKSPALAFTTTKSHVKKDPNPDNEGEYLNLKVSIALPPDGEWPKLLMDAICTAIDQREYIKKLPDNYTEDQEVSALQDTIKQAVKQISRSPEVKGLLASNGLEFSVGAPSVDFVWNFMATGYDNSYTLQYARGTENSETKLSASGIPIAPNLTIGMSASSSSTDVFYERLGSNTLTYFQTRYDGWKSADVVEEWSSFIQENPKALWKLFNSLSDESSVARQELNKLFDGFEDTEVNRNLQSDFEKYLEQVPSVDIEGQSKLLKNLTDSLAETFNEAVSPRSWIAEL
ncbi:hypothetical protein SCG7086_BB_00010 [Chlamydiales bacterium SCGC AG-110-P3]|nr:hypothetical protein SCG7086_BB_00010 [Chlamydiales bacterium SCGC AG-110-P3]